MARYATDGDKAALDQVNGLLERLVSAVGAGARTGSVIEIRVLQALTHHAAGDGTGALLPLEQALTLAEPEGYVRLFVGEGRPMASLLTAVIERRAGWDYVRRLLAAIAEDDGTDLDGPDIARRFFVSLNAMRTHTRSIYAKLGVNSRRAAIRRAEERGILSPGRDR